MILMNLNLSARKETNQRQQLTPQSITAMSTQKPQHFTHNRSSNNNNSNILKWIIRKQRLSSQFNSKTTWRNKKFLFRIFLKPSKEIKLQQIISPMIKLCNRCFSRISSSHNNNNSNPWNSLSKIELDLISLSPLAYLGFFHF